MEIVNVWLEHPVMSLNKTFSYYLKDDQQVKRGVRVKVELLNRVVVGFVDSVQHTSFTMEQLQAEKGYVLKPVIEVCDEQPLINDELYELGLWMSKETCSPVISCFQSMLPKSMKPSSKANKAVRETFVYKTDCNAPLKEKQIEALKLLSKPMLRSEFIKQCSRSIYESLLKKQAIEIKVEEKKASVEQLQIKEADYPLTELQKRAIEKINNSNKEVILLHGLTGSGKTEIYMQLAAQKCRQGRQVLILVPEISLTPQMIRRLTNRFGANIAIYHSSLTDQQRYEQYQLVKNNKVKLVVGTRSAVFMPFDNLGLIVLDEEHDNSYKQDSTPKYNCRDVAIKRAKTHNCKVILGSATPTLDSYTRAIKNVYELVTLNQRINNSLPTSYLIDMQKEGRKGNYIVSAPLKAALVDRFNKQEQSILLLNRRGYTPIMKCGKCGYVVKCPHCDIAMSYHKDKNLLVCHTCGSTASTAISCPECGSNRWGNYGIGTQRLAEEIQRFLPEAKILRMDADTTAVKDGHEKILSQFEKHEADILLGTQMIAKGLDYPDVTLVGIFGADALLARTDYRCAETTFNLIVQASGRSGRAKRKGEVFVQAFDVNHYSIVDAVKQDYLSFFKEEMNYRHLANYPPYCYLVSINFSSRKEENGANNAMKCAKYFSNNELIKTLGPSTLIKKMDNYRFRVVLKSKDNKYLKDEVYKWFSNLEYNKSSVNVQVDFDPYVME